QVTAVSPTVGVTLGGVGPVRARAGGVFSVVGQRGGRDRIGNAGAGQELGQVHVVALGRAGTEPLAVTNDDIPAIATGGHLGEAAILERGPGLLDDVHLDAGLGT